MPVLLIILLIHSSIEKNLFTPLILVKIMPRQVTVQAGRNGVIRILVKVKKGYHIQANKVSDEFMIPTTLEIDPEKDIITGQQVFPPGKKFKLEGSETLAEVYDGTFEVRMPFTTTEKTKKGRRQLNAKLHYQGCDFKQCYFPSRVDFAIPIEVK
jgi:uncharacterized protein